DHLGKGLGTAGKNLLERINEAILELVGRGGAVLPRDVHALLDAAAAAGLAFFQEGVVVHQSTRTSRRSASRFISNWTRSRSPGSLVHLPVGIWKRAPCSGHSISSPSTKPMESIASACGQMSSSA